MSDLTIWISEYTDFLEDCNYAWSDWEEVPRSIYEHWQPHFRETPHQIARTLREIYHCSFIAVRPTKLGKPRPVDSNA